MTIPFRLVAVSALLSIFIYDLAPAQTSTAAFPSLTYPHSIFSGAMGELGVTMMNATDAMQYNPANLVHSGNASLTFFRDPFAQIGRPYPLTSMSMSLKPSEGTSFGFEYTDWNFGTIPVTTVEYPDGTGQTYDVYERSFAGAFALSVGRGVSLGAEIRYAMKSMFTLNLHHTVFSAGLLYVPVSLGDRMHLGVSLMNFGTPAQYSTLALAYPQGSVQVEGDIPMPARIHLGADYAIIRRPLFDLTLALGFTKPIDKRDEQPVAVPQVLGVARTDNLSQSSFESLFTAWSDFPEDVTTHIGLAYRFKPLPLGRGVAFFQEMYLGYFSVGTSLRYYSLFTHGVRAGLEIGGVQASAGYAGRWHDNSVPQFYGGRLSETFQFQLSTRIDPFTQRAPAADNADRLSNLIVSAGFSHCMQLVNTNGLERLTPTLAYEMPSLWSVESDFYLSENSALIASFAYGHMEQTWTLVGIDPSLWKVSLDIETISLESGYRYHPVPAFHPLFLQASLGIMRLNPVDDYSGLRHIYYTYDDLAIGCVVPLGDTPVIVMPKAGLRTIYWFSLPESKKFSGDSQFEFGLNLGYML